MGHTGMKYSLVTRDLIADSTEAMVMAHGFDGLVMIPNCDKNVPGLLMAAARLNIPTVFVSGGPMLAGRVNGKKRSLSSMFEAVGAYKAGKIDEKQLTELVLKKSGGLFAFATKFATVVATFLLNILMTFFFFSLLLGKLAGFVNSRKAEDRTAGDNGDQTACYLVRTVFNGKWLPQMSEENLREGDRIVGEVFNKLRIWLRGYMTMVTIDFCVYTTVFYLLDVPYAPVLGAVAAVGILLPYIEPVSSALLTVLVTLAVGGADVSVQQIAGIIGIYLLHNGIIEQFFIYPAVIGESLGLSTLETIIVVLLGGIIAGIPGMIFALPTASVIKYLVPQIYRCWR